ncbi:hypothetical protein ACMYR3_06950 [Ampullimonas aquatilis]|uniref:hypothetical protein n=1 Tax=Ampullimonas aquatilis TaxID=1341549 RepID=UPI003C72335F
MASTLVRLWQRLRHAIRRYQSSLLAVMVAISTLLIGQHWQQAASSFPFVISALMSHRHNKSLTQPRPVFHLTRWGIKYPASIMALNASAQHAMMSVLGWACYHLPCNASWHHLIGVIVLIVASQHVKHLPALASGGATLLGAPLMALLAQTAAFGLLMQLEKTASSP